MMKILQICTGFDIAFNGGITNYVRNISEELHKEGFDVNVLYSQKVAEDSSYPYKTINFSPELHPFHLSSVIQNGDVEKLDSMIKDINPEIIHVHMMIDLPINVLKIFKKYSKLVISLHDYSFICNRIILLDKNSELCEDSNNNLKCNSCISFEDTIDNRLLRGGFKLFKNLVIPNKSLKSSGHNFKFEVAKSCFNNADAVIAVSSRVKEIYESNNFRNDKFYVNHIGNYTAESSFRSSFKDRPLIENSEKIKFGFIGNLIKSKGSDLFMEIAKQSRHEFHIYGGINPELLDIIDDSNNIFYHGRYDHKDLVRILQEVNIGLVLSIWEDNAPQVVFEFLNAGIPIIATKMGGIPDFVNDSNGFLFSCDDEGMTEVIDFINSDDIYNFYNTKINKIPRTKMASEHLKELLTIYNQVL